MKKFLAVLLCITTMIMMFSTMFASAASVVPAESTGTGVADLSAFTDIFSKIDWASLFNIFISVGKFLAAVIPFDGLWKTIKGMIDSIYNR